MPSNHVRFGSDRQSKAEQGWTMSKRNAMLCTLHQATAPVSMHCGSGGFLLLLLLLELVLLLLLLVLIASKSMLQGDLRGPSRGLEPSQGCLHPVLAKSTIRLTLGYLTVKPQRSRMMPERI